MADANIKEQTTMANTILRLLEAIFADQLKIERRIEKNVEPDIRFIEAMKNGGTKPVFNVVDMTIANDYQKKLEQYGIPYLRFYAVDTSKDIFLVSPDQLQAVKAVDMEVRIASGLEMETREDLESSMSLFKPHENMQIYQGLTETEADLAIHMAREKINKEEQAITLVKEKDVNGTFNLYCNENDRDIANEIVVNAVVSSSIHTKDMQSAVASYNYHLHQHSLFIDGLDDMKDGGYVAPSMLISQDDPNSYVALHGNSCVLYLEGTIKTCRKQNDPALYAETIKYFARQIKDPIYFQGTVEDYNKMGRQALTAEAKKQAPDRKPWLTLAHYQDLKNWINNNIQFNPPGSYERRVKPLKMKEFLSKGEIEPTQKEIYQKQQDNMQKDLDRISDRLVEITSGQERVRQHFEWVLSPEDAENSYASTDYIKNIMKGDAFDDYTAEERKVSSANTKQTEIEHQVSYERETQPHDEELSFSEKDLGQTLINKSGKRAEQREEDLE